MWKHFKRVSQNMLYHNNIQLAKKKKTKNLVENKKKKTFHFPNLKNQQAKIH